ncbi:MAG: hypothetical protein ACT4P8_08970 [Betaproteobacteria bacterium]
MKALLWTIVIVLVILAFAGDRVRGYFADEAVVAQESAAASGPGEKTAGKNDSAQRAASGNYVPSPADAPELYDSPTRRLGF